MDIVIISAFTLIIGFFLDRKFRQDSNAYEEKRCETMEDMEGISMQQMEDHKMEFAIIEASHDLMKDYLGTPFTRMPNGERKKIFVAIVSPARLAYTVYHEETAKFKNKDIVRLVMDHFNKVKKELENELQDHN